MAEQLTLMPELAERERILSYLESDHPAYLEFCRAIAREIALRNGEVAIDDVRDELARRDLPMPHDFGVTDRLLGPLFRTVDFEPVGQRLTRRLDRIARSGLGSSFIGVYRLRGSV